MLANRNKSLILGDLDSFPFFCSPSKWPEERETVGLTHDQGLALYEDEQNLCIEAKMPGLTADSIDISVDNGVLRVKGKKVEETAEGVTYHRKTSYDYTYQVAVPEKADASEAKAVYKNGVMTITLPKLKESQGRKIEVMQG